MGKFAGASRNAIPVPVRLPVNRPGKLSGPVVTGSFEKQAPGPFTTTRLSLIKITKSFELLMETTVMLLIFAVFVYVL